MKKCTRLMAALSLTALLLTGCGGPKGAVTVGDVAFTLEDYKAVYSLAKNTIDLRLAMQGVTPEQVLTKEEDKKVYEESIQSMAKNQLIFEAVFETQMKKDGLELDEEKVDEAMKEQDEQNGGAELLDEYLSQLGMTREQYRRIIAIDQRVHQLRVHYVDKHPDDVRALFDKDFMRCRHILIMDPDGTPEKEALAKDVAKKAQDGADFQKLIDEYNEDPGMQDNEDGYVFTYGKMEPAFESATQALEIDGISEPVKSNYGWHIIQRLPLRDRDYEVHKPEAQDAYFASLADKWADEAEFTMSEEAEAVTVESLEEERKAAAAEQAQQDQKDEKDQKGKTETDVPEDAKGNETNVPSKADAPETHAPAEQKNTEKKDEN